MLARACLRRPLSESIHPKCVREADLRAFAAAIRPRLTVPAHGVKWDEESRGFGSIRRLADAESLVIG